MWELLSYFFKLNWSASWLILAVVMARFFLRRSSREIHCLLWLLVALRLLIPFNIESRWSLIPEKIPVTATSKLPTLPPVQATLEVVDQMVTPVLSETSTQTSAINQLTHHLDVVAIGIWLTGALVLATFSAMKLARLRMSLHTATHLDNNIYESQHISTPFVLGVIRPKIYLPTNLPKAERELAIAHEQSHLSHADPCWKILGWLLACVNWFNPLVWWAWRLFNHDLELACDERVIKKLAFADRQAYARELVEMSAVRPAWSLATLSFTGTPVYQRIQNILEYRSRSSASYVWGGLVWLLVVACFLTNPRPVSLAIAQTETAQNTGVEIYVPSYAIYDREYNFRLYFDTSTRFADDDIIAAARAVGSWCDNLDECQLTELTYSADVTELFNDLAFDSNQPQEMIAFKATFTQAPADPKLPDDADDEGATHWLYLSRPPQGDWTVSI